MKKLKGNTYEERVENQLDEWVKGNSIHNDIEDECCPDFSCCNPKLKQPDETRKTFKAVHLAAEKEPIDPNHHPHYDTRMSMLMMFLQSSLSEEIDRGEVIVLDIDGKISQN